MIDSEVILQRREPKKMKHQFKAPNNYEKYGLIQRVLVDGDRSRYRRWRNGVDNNQIHPGLTAPDPFGLDEGILSQTPIYNIVPGDVHFSLNKRGRWKHVETLRTQLAELQDEDLGVQVSAIEKYILPGVAPEHNSRRNNTATVYHAVDDEGFEVHRRAKKTMAQEQTLTEKPKPKRKRRNNRRLRHISPVQTPEEQVQEKENIHLRYNVITPFIVEGLYKKKLRDDRHCQYPSKRDRRWFRQQTLYKQWLQQYDSEDEHDESLSEPDNETVPRSLPNLNLFECLSRETVRRDRKPCTSSVPNDSLSKPWLRQISHQSEPEAGPSDETVETEASASQVFITNQVPPMAMEPVNVKVAEWSLDTDELSATYGPHYYECSCLPRRFCVDISECARDVMAVAHRDKAQECVVQAIAVFEVPTPTLADLKIICDYPEEDPVMPVRFWLNVRFSDAARGLILRPKIQNGSRQALEKLIKDAAVLVGTLPTAYFDQHDATEPKPNLKHRDSSASLLDLFPQSLKPKTKCLINGQVATHALQETDMARKLQRQITAVRTYQGYLETGDNMCGVCMEWPITEGICLAHCRHWFCAECWQLHCNERLTAGLVPIKCPDVDCDRVLDYDLLTTLLPLNRCQMYSTLLSERHLLQNAQNWVWCPSQNCGRLLRISGRNELGILLCECGHVWCAECSENPHWPVACEHSSRYIERVKNHGDDLTKRQLLATSKTVKVKRCPRCGTPMERSFGCNHMVCRCGSEFCWACASPWDGGHHYGCGITENFETMVLRDVNKQSDNAMKIDYYKRCVEHRHALLADRQHKIKSAPIAKKRPELGKNFMAVYEQAHCLLEYSYVWMYFHKVKAFDQKLALRTIRTLADRLNFVIGHAEQLYLDGQEKRVDALVPHAKKLLKKITMRIWAFRQ